MSPARIWYTELINYSSITMEFKKIIERYYNHMRLHQMKALAAYKTEIHLYAQCYPPKSEKITAKFDRF